MPGESGNRGGQACQRTTVVAGAPGGLLRICGFRRGSNGTCNGSPAPTSADTSGTPSDAVTPITTFTEVATDVVTAGGRAKPRQTRSSQTFPVQIRSMNAPRPGWTVDRAVGQIAQGYTVEQVSRLSGYAVAFLRARL